MRQFIGYVGMVAVLTITCHIAWLSCYPYFATTKVVSNIAALRKKNVEFNVLGHSELRYAGRDVVARDNPDTMTSFAVYDVSNKPQRVHCVIPASDNYWSLSLFAWNTDNFFVVNDRTAKSREFDLVIAKRGTLYRAEDQEQVVYSPTPQGILIVRLIVSNRGDNAEIARIGEIQKKSYIASK